MAISADRSCTMRATICAHDQRDSNNAVAYNIARMGSILMTSPADYKAIFVAAAGHDASSNADSLLPNHYLTGGSLDVHINLCRGRFARGETAVWSLVL